MEFTSEQVLSVFFMSVVKYWFTIVNPEKRGR